MGCTPLTTTPILGSAHPPTHPLVLADVLTFPFPEPADTCLSCSLASRGMSPGNEWELEDPALSSHVS